MTLFETLFAGLGERASEKNRVRGLALAEAGKVTPLRSHAGRVHARVQDQTRGGPVDVELRSHASDYYGGRGPAWYCSCGSTSYQATAKMCAHAWAVMVAADSQGWAGEDAYTAQRQGGLRRPTQSLSVARSGWKVRLGSVNSVETNLSVVPRYSRRSWPAGRELLYVVDCEGSGGDGEVIVQTMTRDRKAEGQWGVPKAFRAGNAALDELPDSQDRVIVSMLVGADAGPDYGSYRIGFGYSYAESESRFSLDRGMTAAAMPMIVKTGRCFLRKGDRLLPQPLRWGEDRPWKLSLIVTHDEESASYRLRGALARDDRRVDLAEANVLSAGLVVFSDVIEPAQLGEGAAGWLAALGPAREVYVPVEAGLEFVEHLYSMPRPPELILPDELKLEEVTPPASVHVKIRPANRYEYDARLRATLEFDYNGKRFDSRHVSAPMVDRTSRRIILRNDQFEAECIAQMYQAGFRDGWHYSNGKDNFVLTPSKLAKVVPSLVRKGWHVEAEGKLYRQPGEFRIDVTSGIDWFELHGGVDFGDQTVPLPKLLAALRKGESLVQLGDGTVGMLPEDWLRKYGVLAGMGQEEGNHLRFSRAQAGLLDALLAAQPQARCDGIFENTRRMLRSFEGIAAAEAPPTFTGELRPYQKDGLGWLHFLRKFSFGGCLADDMGLGKTVQVLAMLAGRRIERESGRQGEREKKRSPTLIVVPRSLVFNWLQEASRFAPDLKILDHSHHARTKTADHFSDYDVVLTTYGTLRKDAAYLKDAEFDYVILDEAQAIKNPTSESAKAARLLRGRQRLALSGTPVQNHLGDLWSLFEFLNPGMLGASTVLAGANGSARSVPDETKNLLAKALRPFILRRTKEQVANDLPEKLEQTIYCELDSTQRKAYDELKQFYRAKLLDLVTREGMNKAKIQILEALLRLRQAACHPGLIDKTKGDESSAKLETLLPRLDEVVDEGHKALVFSQFTTFLSIVKRRLDKDKIVYEYLDGKTKDRQARVERFQTDPDCKVFLISLKAGGVGLNLTAADYVFLLDPWWNPAVESQAIDRTHRIGQTRQVFACRLIAKDTVEEKVLELQKTKRALADAIINADNSVISGLGRAELELLLS